MNETALLARITSSSGCAGRPGRRDERPGLRRQPFTAGQPPKLRHITTGNLPNDALIRLVRSNWNGLLAMLSQGDFVEMGRSSITLHG